MWKKATKKTKRFKICIVGPPGAYKTRTMLRLANNPEGEPALAVVDTEAGTDHFADEFNFLRVQSPEPNEITRAVNEILQKPGPIKCLAIDSFSLYCEAVTSKYTDFYLIRELNSPGYKKEYYQLQPRDFQPINREITKTIKKLLDCDLNIIVTCQSKDLWGDNFKVIGTTHDGFRRLPYYFDIVIFVEDDKKCGLRAAVTKDRTHFFPKTFPWTDDKVAYAEFVKALGCDLTSGESARPYVETADPISLSTEKIVKSEETTSVSHEQLKAIKGLKLELQISDHDQWTTLLKPFNAESAKNLTASQGTDFVKSLEALRPTEPQAA